MEPQRGLPLTFRWKDFDGQFGFAADANGFVKRGHFRSAFAAHVRGVKAAVLGGDLREGDEFVGFRVNVWRIDERAGDAQSAVLHGLLDEGFHLLELGGSGSAIVVANHGFADLRGADVGAEVERRALLFETAEVAVESGPIDGEFVLVEERLHAAR